MISRQEIIEFSRELGLSPNVIEKDYVLGWLLAGIGSHPGLASTWVFKGGTCLKKCYFETYRFSEDLDFTLIEAGHLDEELLVRTFQEIADWIYDTTGIEVPHDTIRFQVYGNPRGGVSAEGRVGYRGPLARRRGDPARIKLDLTGDEILVLESVRRAVHHPYSDGPTDGIQVLCYCFEEVFAEKVRALAERERPRDLYDVVHIHRHDGMELDRVLTMQALKEKCAFKGIGLPSVEILESQPQRVELEAEWSNMLAHQLPVLPPFEQFWTALPAVFEWLYRAVEKAPASAIPAIGAAIDEMWHPPVMAQAWGAAVPLELIRFAAANRLCVNLAYRGSWRLIEPYSLRRTREGNLLLFAVKHDTGELRSYRVDWIQNAEATKEPFTPRYAIELTPHGPISAPATVREPRGLGPLGRSSFGRSSRLPSRITSSYGPKYVFRCPLCGKQFSRKTYDATLNPHKNKQGYACAGRVGVQIAVK